MAFLSARKKRRFQVMLCLHELSSVPFVSGVLFTKIRLLDGGNFSYVSQPSNVIDHRVAWDEALDFECKISGCAQTGLLEPCRMRVSVRKEAKGGKSFSKVGYADVDLTEFADSGQVGRERRYLLEGYSLTKRQPSRQDNSTLLLTVGMLLIQGDPVFKVPSRGGEYKSAECEVFEPDRQEEESYSESSGRNSGGRQASECNPAAVCTDLLGSGDLGGELFDDSQHPFYAGHTRNLSAFSIQSQYSGNCCTSILPVAANGLAAHNRVVVTAAAAAAVATCFDSSAAFQDIVARRSSNGANFNELSLDRRRKAGGDTGSLQSRIQSSRVDNEDVVTSILQSHQFNAANNHLFVPTASVNAGPCDQGSLQLSVARDGTAQLVSVTNGVCSEPCSPSRHINKNSQAAFHS